MERPGTNQRYQPPRTDAESVRGALKIAICAGSFLDFQAAAVFQKVLDQEGYSTQCKEILNVGEAVSDIQNDVVDVVFASPARHGAFFADCSEDVLVLNRAYESDSSCFPAVSKSAISAQRILKCTLKLLRRVFLPKQALEEMESYNLSSAADKGHEWYANRSDVVASWSDPNFYSPEERLKQLGVALPPPAAGVGEYVSWLSQGDSVMTSLQLPWLEDGKSLLVEGSCGSEAVPLSKGIEAARQSCLNGIAQMKNAAEAFGGDLSWVKLVCVEGNVACAPGFYNSPEVLDGASRLLVDVFGDSGLHTRTALHFPSLPLNLPVLLGFKFTVCNPKTS